MKKQELYNILYNGRKIYSSLTETEYLETLENLAEEYYETGSPDPANIETEVINEWQNHQA